MTDETGTVDGPVTIRNTIQVWAREMDSGMARAAVLRRRYRARGGHWGPPGGANGGPMLIAEPGLSNVEMAVAAVCAALRVTTPGEEVYLSVNYATSLKLQELIRGEGVADLPQVVQRVIEEAMPMLAQAHIEALDRRAFRTLAKQVGDSVDDSRFEGISKKVRQVDAGRRSRTHAPDAVSVDEPGWAVDWGCSRKYEAASVAFVEVEPPGNPVSHCKVMAIPADSAAVQHGELDAVLAAYRYSLTCGRPGEIFYTDSRDTARRLKAFVELRRPVSFGTLLVELAAPFSDEELLGLDVRWVYRSSNRAMRLVDLAVRTMYRGEAVLEESVVQLPWLLHADS
ncbi:hypothetical protein [Streptomyces sp. NPDC054838]